MFKKITLALLLTACTAVLTVEASPWGRRSSQKIDQSSRENLIVSVTRAEVAPDLKYASVYFSCIGDSAEALAGLKKCTGMLRHHLATTLNLRITPELNFVKDGSIEHGARIAKKLEEIREQDRRIKEENASTDGDDE